jgi:uncharacterized protein (TIGR02996 family)
MTDGEALLRGVLAEPFCNVPRLVYADWLEENGEPERAEFIRAHINLNKQEYDQWAKERCDAVFGPAIPGERRPNFAKWFPGSYDCNLRLFDRGFCKEVWFIGLNAFKLLHKEVFESQPIVSVSVDGKYPTEINSNSYDLLYVFFKAPKDIISPACLTEDLFDEMKKNLMRPNLIVVDEVIYFRTRQEGMEALSRTLVNYARVRVGLERLKFPAYA